MRSFEIDHKKLLPGLYLHSKSGFVTTWDMRIKKPNKDDYLDPAVIHTIEHTLAFYLRNRYGNRKIVGIFPMGCQTGFYILTRFISRGEIWEAIDNYIRDVNLIFSIPGATEEQCGNYKLQDLYGAKKVLTVYRDKWLYYHGKAINYEDYFV